MKYEQFAPHDRLRLRPGPVAISIVARYLNIFPLFPKNGFIVSSLIPANPHGMGIFFYATLFALQLPTRHFCKLGGKKGWVLLSAPAGKSGALSRIESAFSEVWVYKEVLPACI